MGTNMKRLLIATTLALLLTPAHAGVVKNKQIVMFCENMTLWCNGFLLGVLEATGGCSIFNHKGTEKSAVEYFIAWSKQHPEYDELPAPQVINKLFDCVRE